MLICYSFFNFCFFPFLGSKHLGSATAVGIQRFCMLNKKGLNLTGEIEEYEVSEWQ